MTLKTNSNVFIKKTLNIYKCNGEFNWVICIPLDFYVNANCNKFVPL